MSEALNRVVSLKVQQPSAAGETPMAKQTRPQKRRRRLLAISFVLCVIIPSILGALYFTFIASDRYVAGVGFAVRSMDAGSGGDFFGTFTGIANAGSTTSDSYILLKYIKSRSLVEKLEKDFPLRLAYASDGPDIISHLRPQSDIEHVVEYWGGMIQTSYDNISGVITFKVNAFTPDDARKVADLVLRYCTDLVNELSERARTDAVSFANGEVAHAEERLRNALGKLRSFRDDEQSIDPTRSAQVQIEIVGGLEKELADRRARISALVGTVDEGSPSLKILRRQTDALEQEIAAKKLEATKGEGNKSRSSNALSGLLATYETLEVERNFAQQAYASALSSLEKARVEAGRQQRYLAIYEAPLLPEYPLYPKRFLNSLQLGAILTMLWGLGSLIIYSIRDHLS
ncbi:lipopolysaccharide biosynthesis protein [Ochrobactrum teleogrylli]|uniref:Lipopolysaccharide biosynthesis protein n=1 Tax=Ochrobactrum teleogrylli TaxID=2479765 RepID=A0ABY2Y4E2_9HYPH|nr:lipopolysaccharide biosynthesis protein [[Ochrobactrum] teleogrylli]TNV14181.1 lipopolysaccharide biosynthesis protein [[Ochrobactrum] teleogrylli]